MTGPIEIVHNHAAAKGHTSGPPASPRDGLRQIGDFYEAFDFTRDGTYLSTLPEFEMGGMYETLDNQNVIYLTAKCTKVGYKYSRAREKVRRSTNESPANDVAKNMGSKRLS